MRKTRVSSIVLLLTLYFCRVPGSVRKMMETKPRRKPSVVAIASICIPRLKQEDSRDNR